MKQQNGIIRFILNHRKGLPKIGGVMAMLGLAYASGYSAQTAKNKAAEAKARKEQEKELNRKAYENAREAYKADPNNHLGDCGLVEDYYLSEGPSINDHPVINLIISDVPLSKMGELGQEILNRAHDGRSHGCLDRDDLDTAALYENLLNGDTRCSIVISMYPGEQEEEADEEAPVIDEKSGEAEESRPAEELAAEIADQIQNDGQTREETIESLLDQLVGEKQKEAPVINEEVQE